MAGKRKGEAKSKARTSKLLIIFIVGIFIAMIFFTTKVTVYSVADQEYVDVQLVSGNYTISAWALFDAKAIIYEPLLLDWIANGNPASQVEISYSYTTTLQNANLNDVKVSLYFKEDENDGVWRLYDTKTHTSESGSSSWTVLFGDLDTWYENYGVNLDDLMEHTIHIGIRLTIDAIGAITGNTLSADSGIAEIGYFTLKWKESKPDSGLDVTKTYFAVPLIFFAVLLFVVAIYLDRRREE